MLRKAEKKNERDGRDAGAPDRRKAKNEKQKNPKSSLETSERTEPRKVRPVRQATSQSPRLVVKDALAPKKDREKSLDATEPRGRKPSESGSRR